MAYITLFAIILIILLFERTELIFERNDTICIKINFVFFSFGITPSDKKTKKRKNHFLSTVRAANAAFKPLLRGSDAVLVSYTVQNYDTNTSVFKLLIYTTAVNTILAYLGASCKTVSHIKSSLTHPAQSSRIRISLNFRLYRLIICAVFFTYYKLKYAAERKIKNV